MSIIAHIQAAVESSPAASLPLHGMTSAAVLIPIFEKEGEPNLLLTIRSQSVRDHKGQVSFPGGVQDRGESLIETIYRECAEEIGLSRHEIELFGRISDSVTITGYRITPFVGLVACPPPSWITNPAEIERILEIPLRFFSNPAHGRVETFQLRDGEQMPVYFYDHPEACIWGATARIIHQLVSLLPPSG